MGDFLSELLNNLPELNDINTNVLRIVSIIQNILLAFFVLVGIIVVGVALWIAFRLATAEDETKRKDAKKQLLWACIGLLGVVVLMALWFSWIGPSLPGWMGAEALPTLPPPGG